MRQWLPIGMILVALAETSLGQAPLDLGPGDQGATLKQAGLTTPNRLAPAASPALGPWNQTATPSANPAAPAAKRVVFNQVDINKDIEVTPEAGAWLIVAMTYVGDNAPMQARKFVAELRGNYKLNAYVYNYGAKEKLKAIQDAEAERERRREAMRKEGLTPDLPIRVRVEHVQEQTAVLIAANYRNRDEALNDLKNRIRKLKVPDVKKVDLDTIHQQVFSVDPKSKSTELKQTRQEVVNPFEHAFPVRNPLGPKEETSTDNAADVAYLRKVNAEEPFSLFTCKKNYTLVIKRFETPTKMQDSTSNATGFLDRFTTKKAEWMDYAAHNAHNVAEGFRKAGLTETYVLHAKYCSYVTVGGFDDVRDPRLVAMQNFLEGRFQMQELRMLDLVARPVPMQVPH